MITSEKLRKAKKNKSRNNMRCEVEKFARGTDVNIVEWIVQMETFFGISSLKPDAYVGYMMQRILHPYFKEVSRTQGAGVSRLQGEAGRNLRRTRYGDRTTA